MEKQLKDYLHLYLGCDGLDHNGGGAYLGAGTLSKIYCGAMSFKPILRLLSDMTEEEQQELYEVFELSNNKEIDLEKDGKYFITIPMNFEAYKHLLSKHFDLFGLIEAGLAIDATTLNTAPTIEIN